MENKRPERTKECKKEGEDGRCDLEVRCTYGCRDDRNCCYIFPCRVCGKKLGYSIKKYHNPYRPFETSSIRCGSCISQMDSV